MPVVAFHPAGWVHPPALPGLWPPPRSPLPSLAVAFAPRGRMTARLRHDECPARATRDLATTSMTSCPPSLSPIIAAGSPACRHPCEAGRRAPWSAPEVTSVAMTTSAPASLPERTGADRVNTRATSNCCGETSHLQRLGAPTTPPLERSEGRAQTAASSPISSR